MSRFTVIIYFYSGSIPKRHEATTVNVRWIFDTWEFEGYLLYSYTYDYLCIYFVLDELLILQNSSLLKKNYEQFC